MVARQKVEQISTGRLILGGGVAQGGVSGLAGKKREMGLGGGREGG